MIIIRAVNRGFLHQTEEENSHRKKSYFIYSLCLRNHLNTELNTRSFPGMKWFSLPDLEVCSFNLPQC